MSSFKAIYEAQCQKRGEPPDNVGIYSGLDGIWDLVEKQPDLKRALDGDRLIIAVPAPCLINTAPRYYFDNISSKGEPLYFYDPTTDAARAAILNQLDAISAHPMVVMYYGGKPGFLRWMLRRLEKRHAMGSWEAYEKSYT